MQLTLTELRHGKGKGDSTIYTGLVSANQRKIVFYRTLTNTSGVNEWDELSVKGAKPQPESRVG
jgi:hypothetical protein